MKALNKKMSGIYMPGYQHANPKKETSSLDDLILDVLDTDEDRIMYRYSNNLYGSKARSQAKEHRENSRN